MPFLKQTFMWVFFIVAMYLGGAGTQSSHNVLQGMGFVSIVMALICLYIIFKLMWRARGTITTIAVMACIVLYCAYTLGLFNGRTVKEVLAGTQTPAAENVVIPQAQTDNSEVNLFGDNEQPTENTKAAAQQPSQIQNQQTNENGGVVGQVKNFLFGDQNSAPNSVRNMNINPFDYPYVSGYARAVTGSTLRVQGINIKMFGIDAPDISQTCADSHGRAYYCGRKARTWLQNWINNREVTCHILGNVENGWATGVCFLDNNKYDIAAQTVEAGWAVAFTQNTDVYVDYENQARVNRHGLWAGTFYKPLDWRKIQNRKVDIKVKYNVPKPTQTKKKSKFDFWGLF